MNKISATILTLNEEDNIRECLETLTWCDEIIVVDGYSDDATVEIAREYTDKIFTYERTGYSEPAREKAIAEASGNWICMIDADERIPSPLANQLREVVRSESADVVHAPRKNYLLGQWIDGAGWWPDYRPVLYKKSVTDTSKDIHDFLHFKESAVENKIDPKEDNAITHFNYTGVEDFIERTNRYTTIEANQMKFKHRQFLTKPIWSFLYRYVIKGGYRMGISGFLLSALMAWYKFLSVAKAWQYEYIGDDSDIREKYDKINSDLKE